MTTYLRDWQPGEREGTARILADQIKGRRNGLANEESEEMRTYHPTYVRARKYRDQERAEINGMRIALTFLLGAPLDMMLADAFIADAPEWPALLPEEERSS